MLKLCLLAALNLSVGLVIAADAKEDAKKDKAALQGRWQIVGAAEEGKAETTKNLKKVELVIKGDQLTLDKDGDKLETSFTIDAAKKPRAIDLKLGNGPAKGQVLEALYELDGDTLRLCWDEYTLKRPAEIKSKKEGAMVLTFKRDKP
jgi:uncharacterized protein (TIGR03067 family)